MDSPFRVYRTRIYYQNSEEFHAIILSQLFYLESHAFSEHKMATSAKDELGKL